MKTLATVIGAVGLALVSLHYFMWLFGDLYLPRVAKRYSRVTALAVTVAAIAFMFVSLVLFANDR